MWQETCLIHQAILQKRRKGGSRAIAHCGVMPTRRGSAFNVATMDIVRMTSVRQCCYCFREPKIFSLALPNPMTGGGAEEQTLRSDTRLRSLRCRRIWTSTHPSITFSEFPVGKNHQSSVSQVVLHRRVLSRSSGRDLIQRNARWSMRMLFATVVVRGARNQLSEIGYWSLALLRHLGDVQKRTLLFLVQKPRCTPNTCPRDVFEDVTRIPTDVTWRGHGGRKIRPRYRHFWTRDCCSCHWRHEGEGLQKRVFFSGCNIGCAGCRCKVQGTCHYASTSDCQSRAGPRLGRWVQAPRVHFEHLPVQGKTGRAEDATPIPADAHLVTQLHGECTVQQGTVETNFFVRPFPRNRSAHGEEETVSRSWCLCRWRRHREWHD